MKTPAWISNRLSQSLLSRSGPCTDLLPSHLRIPRTNPDVNDVIVSVMYVVTTPGNFVPLFDVPHQVHTIFFVVI